MRGWTCVWQLQALGCDDLLSEQVSGVAGPANFGYLFFSIWFAFVSDAVILRAILVSRALRGSDSGRSKLGLS